MPRVTVRKKKRTGIMSVDAAPQGFEIYVGGNRVGAVSPRSTGWMKWSKWYWYVADTALGIEARNTAATKEFTETKEEARDQAVAYVKACLAKVAK